MKKILTLFLFLNLLFVHTVSSQVASDTLGCVPMPVKFKSPFSGLFNPVWDFGDGASSNIINPQHIYIEPGVYTVRLTNFDTLVATATITVFPEIVPDMIADITVGCAPNTISFTNQTVLPTGLNIRSLQWDFGDGVGSVELNPQHTYEDIGVFDVVLTIETNIEACNNTRVFDKYIEIKEKQDVGFRLDSLSKSCEPPILAYFSYVGDFGSDYTIQWDFGNGVTSSLQNPTPIQYDVLGTYTVSLRVDNNKNCVSNIKESFLISNFPSIDGKVSDELCLDNFVRFQNFIPENTYFWEFDSTANIQSSSLILPTNIKYNSEGLKQIKLRVTSPAGCSIDTSFSVLVKQADASFTLDPPIICNPPTELILKANTKDALRYVWDGEIGDSIKIIKIEYPERDTFYYHERDSINVTLRIRDKNGCTGVFRSHYIVQPINAQFELSAHEGETPFLLWVHDKSETDCPIVKWTYDWGDGTQSVYNRSNIGTARHLYENAGEYYINLSIEDEKGCKDDHYGAWIEVKDPLRFNNEPPTCSGTGGTNVICYKDTFRIIVENIPEGVDGIHVNLGHTLGHCEKDSMITVVALDDPNVFLPSSFSLENAGVFYEFGAPGFIYRGAKAIIEYKISCEEKYKVFFKNTSLNALSYYWIVDSMTYLQNEFYHQFPSAGDYEVLLIAENEAHGCLADTARVTIMLRDPKAVITTVDDWCPGVSYTMSSELSEDEVAGCKMGYLWSFPKPLDIPNIITDRDKVEAKLPSGIHRISLEVRDVNGCRDTAYKDINVVFLDADFTSDKIRFCEPLTGTFFNNSSSDLPIVNYQWNLAPNENKTSISYTFANSQQGDSLRVSLVITDSLGCKSSKIKFFQIYRPESNIIYDEIMCLSNLGVVEASDFNIYGSFLNYSWQINDQSVAADNVLPLINLPVGIHNIKLRIVEDSTQCFNNYDFNIQVVDDPIAKINAIDSVFCFPKTLFLSSDESYSHPLDNVKFEWNFGNNRKSARSNPVVTFGKGTFDIQLTLTSNLGCVSTDTKKISLVGPDGLMVADKEIVCLGDDIVFTLVNPQDVSSFYWDFGQGQTRSNVSPVAYNYDFLPPSSTTFASLVLQSEETGCETVLSLPIEIAAFQALFESDTTCEDTLTIISNSIGADRLRWLLNGLEVSNDSSPLITVNSPGIYSLTLIINNEQWGCIDTLSQNLIFLERPSFDVPSEVILCSDKRLTYPINPNYTYTFSPLGFAQVVAGQILFSANSSSILEVRATANNGCQLSKLVNVSHSDFTIEDQTDDWVVCNNVKNTPLEFQIFEGDSLVWYLNNNLIGNDILSCSDCPNPVIESEINGVLFLNILNYNTCLNRSFEYNIENVSIEMPNIFSPNGDNINDLFRPVQMSVPMNEMSLEILNLKVINRWGKEVYNSNQPWDGNINGFPAPAEVYYFSAEYGIGDRCYQKVKGDVTLMR